MMWTLDEALKVVRELQPKLRPLDFHVALGGGVINTGESDNDLDLYILPVFLGREYDFVALEQLIYDTFGGHSDMTRTSEGPTGREGPTYIWQMRCRKQGKVVDVFVGNPHEKK